MAGGGHDDSGEENPVPVNCVALIDIIFCLCLFFMCSLHFQTLQGKLDTSLPKGEGILSERTPKVLLDEVRVVLRWDQVSRRVEMHLGRRPVESKDALRGLIRESRADAVAAGRRLPVRIDAGPSVPWSDVVVAVDACRLEDEMGETIDVQFAAPVSGRM